VKPETANLQPETTIAIIGLGYVGFPLAVEFAKHYPTLGFDIDRAPSTIPGGH